MIQPITHQIIDTKSAPSAIGPYSQAVKAGDAVEIDQVGPAIVVNRLQEQELVA